MAQCGHPTGSRHDWHASIGRYPARGTLTRTGPLGIAVRSISMATEGIRDADRAGSATMSTATCTRGMRLRRTARGTSRGASHPEAAILAPSRVTQEPPTTSEAPVSALRRAATSRACQPGACGSARESSPSSQTTIRPRSTTGANTDARVPTTTRAAPDSTPRKAR